MPALVLAYFCARRGIVPASIDPVDCACGGVAWRVEFAAPVLTPLGLPVGYAYGHIPQLVVMLRDAEPIEVEA